jgi:hypothetical protein
MYYVLAVHRDGECLAKVVATAPTSTQARRTALELDAALFGRALGRTFYLDQESYIRWRVAGRVAASDFLPDPQPALTDAAGSPA